MAINDNGIGDENNNSSWITWGKHVLKELERLDDNIKETHEKLNIMSVKIAELSVKATIWGAIVAFVISAGLTIAMNFIRK
ncbi:hypothetical protein C0389_06875 [bacterium]|nr:hypothetical protein [bacterium]